MYSELGLGDAQNIILQKHRDFCFQLIITSIFKTINLKEVSLFLLEVKPNT
jgi:hypothetical protein